MDIATLAMAKAYTDNRLPVVELETVLDEKPVQLSDEENAKLAEVASKGCPIVVRLKAICKDDAVGDGYVHYNLSVVANRFAQFDPADNTTESEMFFSYVGHVSGNHQLVFRASVVFGAWRASAVMTRVT